MIPAGLALPSMAPIAASFGGLTFGSWTALPYTQAYQLAPAGIQGLDLPAMVTGDVQRPRDHGELRGLDLIGGRDIVIDLIVGPTATTTLQENLAALRNAVVPAGAASVSEGNEEAPLWIQMPDALYGVMARVRRRGFTVDQAYVVAGSAAVSIMFHASDPRVYACPTVLASTPLGAASGGITFPVTFPLVIPAGAAIATMAAMNEGNMDCRPVLTFEGPLTNPRAILGSYPGTPTLKFSNPAETGYTLNAGDVLVVDTDAETIFLTTSGSTQAVDRTPWLVPGSTWWTLPPGYSAVEFASDDAGPTGGTLSMQYASAFDGLG